MNLEMQSPLAAVIIVNHNYARFLSRAIETALAQTYRPLEVVVVDDGSTDNSRTVIKEYADRVIPVYKENGGMSSAVCAGLARSSAEVIQLLDADDELEPEAVAAAVGLLAPGIAKVQYRAEWIDAEGNRLGITPPVHRPLPNGDVVDTLLESGRYVTGGTVGCTYARSVLDEYLPVPDDLPALRNSVDGYINAVCPFAGQIVSIDRVLGAYRRHGSNLWATGNMSTASMRARTLHDFARVAAIGRAAQQRGRAVPPDLALRDPEHVTFRIASLRFEPEAHPVPGDSAGRLIRAGMSAIARNAALPAADKAVQAVAIVGVGVLPRSAGRRLFDWVWDRGQRPAWQRALARKVRSLGRRPPVSAPEARPNGEGTTVNRIYKAGKRRLRPWRPRTHAAHVLSYSLPSQAEQLPLPESIWFKKVTRADDKHLAQIEPPWRVRQAVRGFAQGEYCLLAIDGDHAIAKLWVAVRSKGANPFHGPHVRIAADEEYLTGWYVDPEYRHTGLALAMLIEYGEHASARPELHWVHMVHDIDNEASLRAGTKLVPVWESQHCKLLRIGPAFCVKIPLSDKPRFGPLSRKGRHSGHGKHVPGRPPGYSDPLKEIPLRAPRPRAVTASDPNPAGPDWVPPAQPSTEETGWLETSSNTSSDLARAGLRN